MFAASVDLDSLPHYCRIQGLPESLLSAEARALVGTRAIPRLREVFEAAKVPVTFFTIGEDLAEPETAQAVKAAHAAGVEIASHSHAHDYALARRPREVIDADLAQAEAAIAEVTGTKPVGFRAPGYTLSPALLEVLAARGYRYDASAFPAAPYYLAKAGVMAALTLLARPSRSILDRPRVLLAPRVPYRPSLAEPYRAGTAPLLELPVAVTRALRFPFIGTAVSAFPWPIVRRAWADLKDLPLIDFELHAIDALDATDGLPEPLVRQQRDARLPARDKLSRLAEVLRWAKAERETMTLAQAAARLGGSTDEGPVRQAGGDLRSNGPRLIRW
jgi:peptidoglycan-N-acetylglucosamine deacetylase